MNHMIAPLLLVIFFVLD